MIQICALVIQQVTLYSEFGGYLVGITRINTKVKSANIKYVNSNFFLSGLLSPVNKKI